MHERFTSLVTTGACIPPKYVLLQPSSKTTDNTILTTCNHASVCKVYIRLQIGALGESIGLRTNAREATIIVA